jgi:transcriptional regulator of nitric oxide reductase
MRRAKFLLAAALVFPVAATIVVAAQKQIAGFIDPMPTAKLRELFPKAVAFTPRGDVDPLHFTAYGVDPRTPGAKPIGYAFWTIDLVPGELGYHGHIHMLIGMTPAGRLAGVIVDVNTEPYGEISIERPEFPLQFRGKSIRDKFVAGEDVDVVSRATITVRAAAREIRESSRMVARALLAPAAVK